MLFYEIFAECLIFLYVYIRYKWFIDENAAPGIGIREEEVLIESNVKFEVE